MVVASGMLFLRIIFTLSPSVTRISGPGTMPLYAQAVTVTSFKIFHLTGWAVRLKTFCPFSTLNDNSWRPFFSEATATLSCGIASMALRADSFSPDIDNCTGAFLSVTPLFDLFIWKKTTAKRTTARTTKTYLFLSKDSLFIDIYFNRLFMMISLKNHSMMIDPFKCFYKLLYSLFV